MSQLQVDTILNTNGDGAPDFPNGMTVTGVVTATTLNQNITGDIKATGIGSFGSNITAATGIDVLAGGINAVGVVTGTSFVGDGSAISSLPLGQIKGTAGLNIANGATVAVASSDGKFYPVTGVNESFGVPVEALTSAAPINIPNLAYDTVNNKVIAAYQGYNDDQGYLAVGTVSGTTITWAASVKYNGSTNARPTSICYDSTNEKVVVVYREDTGQIWSIVGTVSGTSISFGTKVNVDSNTGNYWPNCAFDSTTGKVIATYRRTTNDRGAARVGTVSGTSISWGPETIWTGTQAITVSEVVCYDGYCVAVSNKYITAGQISGTSINWGTMQNIPFTDGNSNTDETNIAVDPNTGLFMVGGMRDQTDKFLEVFAVTRSGSTLTFGSGLVLKQKNSKNTTCCWAGSENTFFWSFDSGTSGADGLQSCIVEVTGTTSVAKTPRVWYSESGNDVSQGQSCIFDPDTESVVLFFRNAAVSNNGWYYVEKNRISNGTRGGFVGFSNGAYTAGQEATINIPGGKTTNQTGLTTASAYYLLGDGSLATAPDSENLFVGNALSGTTLLVR